MFSIAELLDSAKQKAEIQSDYALAKKLGLYHSAIISYRKGNSLPEERVITAICDITGDDPAIIAATIQAERAKTDAARDLWQSIAARLRSAPRIAQAGVAQILVMLALAAITFVAASPALRDNFVSHLFILCKVLVRKMHQWMRYCFNSLSGPRSLGKLAF